MRTNWMQDIRLASNSSSCRVSSFAGASREEKQKQREDIVCGECQRRYADTQCSYCDYRSCRDCISECQICYRGPFCAFHADQLNHTCMPARPVPEEQKTQEHEKTKTTPDGQNPGTRKDDDRGAEEKKEIQAPEKTTTPQDGQNPGTRKDDDRGAEEKKEIQAPEKTTTPQDGEDQIEDPACQLQHVCLLAMTTAIMKMATTTAMATLQCRWH